MPLALWNLLWRPEPVSVPLGSKAASIFGKEIRGGGSGKRLVRLKQPTEGFLVLNTVRSAFEFERIKRRGPERRAAALQQYIGT